MKKAVLVTIMFLLLVPPASATECTKLAQAAEDAMNKNLKRDPPLLSQVLTDIVQARELHRAGRHAEAIALGNAALQLLGR